MQIVDLDSAEDSATRSSICDRRAPGGSRSRSWPPPMTPTGKQSRTAARSRHDERPAAAPTAPPAPAVPTRARALAARLAALFGRDSEIVGALKAPTTCSPAPTTDCGLTPRRTRSGSTSRSIVPSAPTSERARSAASSPPTSARRSASSSTRSCRPAGPRIRPATPTSTSSPGRSTTGRRER